MNPDDIQEQILITSDGMITRATDIPFSARARKVTVSSHTAAGGVQEVCVMIGTTGKFIWRSDYPAMVMSADGYAWIDGMWLFVDATTYYSIPFVAGKDENRSIPTTIAKTAADATTHQLRLLMNHWLRIRPGVTNEVVDLVYEAITGKWSGARAWRAIKTVPLAQ